MYNFRNYFSVLKANIHTSTYTFSVTFFSVYNCLATGTGNSNSMHAANKTKQHVKVLCAPFSSVVQGCILELKDRDNIYSGCMKHRKFKFEASGTIGHNLEGSLSVSCKVENAEDFEKCKVTY